ncbi:uncharacterized protein BT62DRAFT_937947 [Guyanagaster necrorhizus]|uniref:Uncharacterized protein n=1 Tax=Guyanagaster necrorhizus TaxID=856835 RepID=A0A9P7VGI0_9AGAR|nr:uncharacterized protein BT62DRAFT_937947 [Guyanagaster necrorhizus MCA 3950]KAG7440563.1 hypothetical protein BT62DRAFT_937947 [Guyanagaster necrorhizus MCA 3950]
MTSKFPQILSSVSVLHRTGSIPERTLRRLGRQGSWGMHQYFMKPFLLSELIVSYVGFVFLSYSY